MTYTQWTKKTITSLQDAVKAIVFCVGKVLIYLSRLVLTFESKLHFNTVVMASINNKIQQVFPVIDIIPRHTKTKYQPLKPDTRIVHKY